ncbi:ABC transporter ATP-binding protein [Cyclobacterium sp. 1_MG-2023]|uniref:ABC transporter ATP-binding protein n=1 Tax=Cyclobacterium sp. 1_MG-2023 TaxID=3062681 RepID=UPI0026E414B9|nr:ABC transporter ATP-binding protein [Cyclobacterium sp. 1_MG-2023]MDO6437209.1 ABC transporter ATP-binding protein [Cyclobacterium sp. 1_MG-2023]
METNLDSLRQEQPCIHARNLVLGYENDRQINTVAADVSFDLYRGELTCMMGPNGVGKSTLLKAILNQNPPIKGTILMGKKEIGLLDDQERAKTIAVVLTEKIRSGLMTVRELVALGRTPHTGWLGHLSKTDNEIVERVLKVTHLDLISGKKLAELSDGQRQKAMIARALAQDSGILILDEPTAHLDLTNRFEIMHLLKKLAKEAHKAILVVTHDLEVAMETADQLWIMSHQEPLVSGSPEDLMLEGQIQKLLPGNKWEIDADNGKIMLKTPSVLPEITGPKHVRHWVRNALRKNMDLPLPEKISTTDNPLEIIVYKAQKSITFSSISTMIRFFKKESF